MEALRIAGSGVRAAQEWLDVIAHNVTNMQTAGYKRLKVHFTELVTQPPATEVEGLATPIPPAGHGARVSEPVVDFTPGGPRLTGNLLDVAIDGEGFFEVVRKSGELAYTRVGRLKVDQQGQLVMQTGETLASAITVPPEIEELSISPEGLVQGRERDSAELMELGQLSLARVPDPSGMTALGDGMYAVTAASGDAVMAEPGVDAGRLLQGYEEAPNVNLTVELSDMLLAQRAVQMNARVIQVVDGVMETLVNLRR